MPRLLLLRHSEVESHRGDVPITDKGVRIAADAGRHLAAWEGERLRVISGETRRARETAAAIAGGAREAGAEVVEDGVAFALRNPDLYLAGVRVDMVSSAEKFAVQVPGLTAEDVLGVEFFEQWLTVPDRVGWWVAHSNPPGDTAAAVATRIRAFAGSLGDRPGDGDLIVAITHSPVLRACALDITGADPGEPNWVSGIEAQVHPDRITTMRVLPEAP
ncbi:histidine phosphatase family protein [Saccharopolyspora flava]|uniref:Broad specificity phosphatase PhoE n=1 Tax=Saccharopolyspora flava TaxID=95161 RepID=A0A1I6NVF1_9PSEU|nr:histidine phosphatase family protein [Saccharopolyspora flava]SFS31828.1 Broad specificity phosphatase PhoE [Saccharopolyspora flava]